MACQTRKSRVWKGSTHLARFRDGLEERRVQVADDGLRQSSVHTRVHRGRACKRRGTKQNAITPGMEVSATPEAHCSHTAAQLSPAPSRWRGGRASLGVAGACTSRSDSVAIVSNRDWVQ